MVCALLLFCHFYLSTPRNSIFISPSQFTSSTFLKLYIPSSFFRTSQYLHLLPFSKDQEDGEKLHHPVLSFVKSTGLMPYVDALGGIKSADCQLFLKEYERLLYIKYPPKVVDKEGGKVATLSYKRLFFIGRKL